MGRAWAEDMASTIDVFGRAVREIPKAREDPSLAVAGVYALGLELGLSIGEADPVMARRLRRYLQELRGGERIDPRLVRRYVDAARR